ncbi:hypothetical protein [Agarilytica rhodophyticola]|uniref:hypothetical protein n=1 Tax=Agarilytica rhodophyticola TaxID=1737490 RepID=UPI000B348D9B|nr:hypothetical protein [Agarilytica rhodophyticola]
MFNSVTTKNHALAATCQLSNAPSLATATKSASAHKPSLLGVPVPNTLIGTGSRYAMSGPSNPFNLLDDDITPQLPPSRSSSFHSSRVSRDSAHPSDFSDSPRTSDYMNSRAQGSGGRHGQSQLSRRTHNLEQSGAQAHFQGRHEDAAIRFREAAGLRSNPATERGRDSGHQHAAAMAQSSADKSQRAHDRGTERHKKKVQARRQEHAAKEKAKQKERNRELNRLQQERARKKKEAKAGNASSHRPPQPSRHRRNGSGDSGGSGGASSSSRYCNIN